MTPEEVQQAIKERKVLYYLEIYDCSASSIRRIEPSGISYSPSDGFWRVAFSGGSWIDLARLHPSRKDALIADADRLDQKAALCSSNAQALREQAKRLEEKQDGS